MALTEEAIKKILAQKAEPEKQPEPQQTMPKMQSCSAYNKPCACTLCAAKDRRIVRQSCIKAAVDLTKDKAAVSVPATLKIAEEFENWVYR